MPNEKSESTGFDNENSNLQRGEEGVRTGMGIANDIEVPPVQISDDSKNMIAKQDHEGSDNYTNSSRVRDNR